MCFGSSQQSTTSTNSNYTPASWLSNAAQNNLNFAGNLQAQGFSPYQGQQVANFSPQQQASFGMGQGIAGAVTPNVQTAGTNLGNFLNKTSGGPTITAPTIASQMSPYMNQYVQLALNPQLKQLADQYMLQSQATQGQATSAGAFGDPRAALLQSNLGNNFALQRQGLIGNAYNAAFNTAIGAGAQDVANNVNAQVATGQLGLGTNAQQLAAIQAAFGQGVTGTNLNNTLGAQQTAQQQAQWNALYNQWLMAQQYPFQTTQLANSAIGAATPAAPSTSNSTQTTSTPNNSGWGMVGSIAGAALGNLILPGIGGMIGGSLGGGLGSSFSGASAVGQGAPMTPAQYMGSGSPMVMLPNPNGGGFVPGYARGGRPTPNQPAIVGEKGPEVFVPDKAGTVIPYERLREAMAKKKSVSTDNLSRALGMGRAA